MAKKGTTDNVSIREVYDLVDSAKKETLSAVERVEEKVERLEGGRISLLERDVGDMKAKMSNLEGRVIMIAAIIPIAVTAFFSIINLVLNNKK